MDPYRQSVPDVGLSIQRCTSAVPDDGYYYIVKDGEILGRFRSLKQAQRRYRKLLDQAGYRPQPIEGKAIDPALQAVERYMDQLEEYWGDSSNHRRRGGKTMYRS